jgi:hypothetical protein
MAYVSDDSGRYEVYVRSFPGMEGQWQVSIDGGYQPRWRGDGNELFYFAPDGTLMSAKVDTSAAFRVTSRKPLFKTRADPSEFLWSRYAVAADGDRFLIYSAISNADSRDITVVLNWTAELEP